MFRKTSYFDDLTRVVFRLRITQFITFPVREISSDDNTTVKEFDVLRYHRNFARTYSTLFVNQEKTYVFQTYGAKYYLLTADYAN